MGNLFLFIGTGEIILIFLILILFFGPKKIPTLARDLGSAFRKVKDYTEDIKKNINESVKEPIEEEIKKIDLPENSVKRKK